MKTRCRWISGALLSFVPACSFASLASDPPDIGLRLDLGSGSYDADYREERPSQPPLREEASFDSAAAGLELELGGDLLSVLFLLRQHDVRDRGGSLAVDDSFQEVGLGLRGYLDVVDQLQLFGELGIVVLAGLDFGRAESPVGARMGAGVSWRLSKDVSLEIRGRYTTVRMSDRREIPGEPARTTFETEVSGYEVGLGLTWWF